MDLCSRRSGEITAGFRKLSTVGHLGINNLCIQDVKQYPGVYPLDVSSTFLAVETQNISRLCNCPLGKAKSTPVEKHWVT